MTKLIKGVNDLATLKPELAAEWNYEKNEDLKPEDVTCGSNRKVCWRCSENHEWEATISSRSHGSGCPYCSGNRAISGKNDLATLNPSLAAEWHPTKNGSLTPRDVTCGSSKKVWWLCSKNHEWKATISDRNSNCGCPYCANRKVLPGYNDLATKNPKLAKQWSPKNNIQPTDVLPSSSKMVWWMCEKGHEWQATVNSRAGGNGCPYCANQRVLPGFNDLASQNPSLAAEWHPTKNGDMTPQEVSSSSNKKVWWKCSLGHEWRATISHRKSGRGCPYCAGKRILPGFNDLNTLNPRLAAEWHPTKNGDLTPKDVGPGTEKKVWWRCSKGHEWEAKISNRSHNKGCPYCSGRYPIVGVNDLASQNPSLAAEWHPTKNGKLTPQEVTCASNKKVWWICSLGHEWKATVSHRRESGCPYCTNKKVLAGFNDLASLNPSLASEWHPTKNGNLTPQDVLGGSNKKVWWQCSHGHEWKATISSRNAGRECPICTGRQVQTGFNDLASQNPDLAAEWHPTKNGRLTALDVTVSSGKKVWWQCPQGHEWKATIASRNAGTGCPHCASSHGEDAVAVILNDLNVSYIHDKPLKGCKDKGLLRHDFILLHGNQVFATIEFNGKQHYEPIAFHAEDLAITEQKFQELVRRDTIKTQWLKEHNIPQLIIPYWDFDNIEQIVKEFLDSEEVARSKASNQDSIYVKN